MLYYQRLVKLEFLRLLTRLKLDPARLELITGFFETYLVLNKQEEEQLNHALGKIDKKEADLIMQITTSWHEKGKIEKAQEAICKFMARRFNAESGEVRQKIQQLSSLEILDSLMEELFAANAKEEAQTIIERSIARDLQ